MEDVAVITPGDESQVPIYQVRHFLPRPYPRWSFYDVLERYGELLIRGSDFPPWDGSRGGQEPWSSVVLSKLVLIQRRHGWTDRETVRRARADLEVKACLGLGVEEEGPSQPTLCRHRQRMQELGLDETYLARFVDLVKALELLDADAGVAVDTVPVTGAGQVQDTFNLLAASIRKGLFRLADQLQEQREAVASRLGLERYLARSVKGSAGIDWSDEEQRRKFLAEVVSEARCLQKAIAEAVKASEAARLEGPAQASPEEQGPQPEDDPEGGTAGPVQLSLVGEPESDAPTRPVQPVDDPSKAVELGAELRAASSQLDKIIAHDVETDEAGTVSGIRQVAAADRLISSTDPDMRHGRKSASSLITGFKAQIVAAIAYGWILATRVIAANRHDGKDLPALVRHLEALGLQPAYWLGDHAYGTLDNHLHFRLRNEDPTRPSAELVARNARPGNGGSFTKDEFAIDFETRQLTCPAGNTCTAIWATQQGRRGWLFKFAEADCSGCPLRGQCLNPKASQQTRRTIFVVEERERVLRAHLQRRQEPDFRQKLAQRQVVERANAGFAQCGGKQAQRWGIPATQFDSNLSALAYNLRALGSVLAKRADLQEALNEELDARIQLLLLFLALGLFSRHRELSRHRHSLPLWTPHVRLATGAHWSHP